MQQGSVGNLRRQLKGFLAFFSNGLTAEVNQRKPWPRRAGSGAETVALVVVDAGDGNIIYLKETGTGTGGTGHGRTSEKVDMGGKNPGVLKDIETVLFSI